LDVPATDIPKCKNVPELGVASADDDVEVVPAVVFK
jgi:hypothetical protein